MTIEELLREVTTLATVDECRLVRTAAESRANQLRDHERQRKVTDRWRSIERCKPGTKLYVHGRGTLRIGSIVQTGDTLVVDRIDCERERLHVRQYRIAGKLVRNAEVYVLSPADVSSYELSRGKPAEVATAQDRRTADALARMTRELGVGR